VGSQLVIDIGYRENNVTAGILAKLAIVIFNTFPNATIFF